MYQNQNYKSAENKLKTGLLLNPQIPASPYFQAFISTIASIVSIDRHSEKLGSGLHMAASAGLRTK